LPETPFIDAAVNTSSVFSDGVNIGAAVEVTVACADVETTV
jgi:gamma-glutamyl phosphate reductase